MLNVHVSRLQEYLDKGYVQQGEVENSRVDLLDPERYCTRLMRHGLRCVLDKDHSGKCTSVGFYCDSCGRMCRGTPEAHTYDTNGEETTDHCFMCVRGLRNREPEPDPHYTDTPEPADEELPGPPYPRKAGEALLSPVRKLREELAR